MKNTAIVILAAGNSSRFGSCKQLIQLNSKTLLQHAVDEAIAAGAAAVIVVVGANSEKISKTIEREGVQVVLNQHWEAGMAGSIVTGVEAAFASNGIEKIIVAVSDQPFISAGLFQRLYQRQEEGGKSMVACAYSGTVGTPALFTAIYFDALRDLKGEEGAKKILLSDPQRLATVDFPLGEIDIDTQKDYDNLLSQTQP